MRIQRDSANDKKMADLISALRAVETFHEELTKMENTAYKGDQRRILDAARDEWHKQRDRDYNRSWREERNDRSLVSD